MKVLLIGANGQLASDLRRVLGKDNVIIPLTHSDIEITDAEQVERIVGEKPDLVINTAAFHKVDQCEKEVLKAFQVNALGPRNLALACKTSGSVLLHISTDYVFGGEKREPYIETDLPNPLNVYGITKLAGEHFIRYILDEHFIVRSSGLYGIHKCRAKGGNFVELMLRLAKERDEVKVVYDEVLTPTYTLDLANQIKELIRTEYWGTYHITNNGQCSWYEFARAIFELSGTEVNLKGTASAEFPSPVRRPMYSVLRNKALEDLRMDRMRQWREALGAYLKEVRSNALPLP